MYTDGITETTGSGGKDFGEAGLLASMRDTQDLEAVDILRNIEEAVEQFKLGEQRDDLTLVIARAR
jgi:serine phosphatase RsbU (regulator of sigma subunit)